MQKIIVISAVLIIGWYGNLLYKQNGLPFTQSSVTVSDLKEHEKCITKDGETLYGEIPKGVVCERFEAIKGSLTVLPSTTDKYDKPKNSRNFGFRCDGRQHCSQMTSRAEAEFFVQNCPNTKMDGDYDGIPCERDSRF